MTVVNTETGEILDLDPAAAERRAERITLRLDAIADNYAAVMPMIRESIEKQDHAALGYRSVSEYVSDRFGGSLQRLGVDVRRAVVGELTAAGMSTRAIAPVVGVSHMTIANDLSAGVKPFTPQSTSTEVQRPKPVAEAETSDPSDLAEATARERVSTGADVRPDAPAAPAPVVGIDGKTYPRPVPSPKPQRSGEQQNAEENSRTLASSLIFLLAFKHPNQRDNARDEWAVGCDAVAPTSRAYVTPDRMREAAHGLLALADDWEQTHE